MADLVLESDFLHVVVDAQKGTIRRLANESGVDAVNYVLNVEQAPDFDVVDSRHLGDLVLHVKSSRADAGATMTTGLSSENRSISKCDEAVEILYSGSCSNGGFQGLDVKQVFELERGSGGILMWRVTVTNTSTEDLEIEDLGLPMPMNAWWGHDQTQNYERRVNRHSFIARHGSYMYWQPPSGSGSILLMTPGRGTSLEYKTRYGENERFGENLPTWEGLTEVYVHSKHISVARSTQATPHLPATSISLVPGQSSTWSFNFRFVKDYAGLNDAIFQAVGFDLVSLPGMVVPTNIPITLAVRSIDKIVTIQSNRVETMSITVAGKANGYTLFHFHLGALGENHITITTQNADSVVLQYFGIDPIDRLITKRSEFLTHRQLVRSHKGYNGAFLQWDMSTRKLITWDDYASGGWKEWMAGGSDDLGLAPAVFLSEKCLISPTQEEVAALDYHIDRFLLGYLVNARDVDGKRTFQVYRWYDGKDDVPNDTGIWRAYNYTHIANLFLNMYRLGKAFPTFPTNRTSCEYLKLAFEIMNAMYSKIPVPNPIGDAANTLGLMGESTVPDIIDALAAEQLNEESATLRMYVDRKLQYYTHVKYPFASEQTIDTTGFESVYAFAKLHNRSDLADKCQRASIASRGLQPLWYYYGSDNRMMGEAYWNLGYETQLGAWQQQDYLMTYSDQDRPDFAASMRSTYGAFLAGWANINSGQIDSHPDNIGAAAWICQSEGGQCAWPYMPMLGRWWAWSGEADLGFWGALRTACVNVVVDPIVGLYAYGGQVRLSNGQYTIIPKDGVQQRLFMFNLDKLAICVKNAQYLKATVAEDKSRIELELRHAVASPCVAAVQVVNALEGDYEVRTSRSAENMTVRLTGGRGPGNVISLPKLASSSSYSVTICRKKESL